MLRRCGRLERAFSLAVWAAGALTAAARPAREQAPTPAMPAPATPTPAFDELARRAAEALAAGKLDEALKAYQAGLEQNPQWSDGWWQSGLIHFDAERYAEAKAAFEHVVAQDPETGPGWALLGFCEYRLHNYDRAYETLTRGLTLGLPEGQNVSMAREALHHVALLLVRKGEFVAASKPLARLVQIEADDPELVAACGLMALRMARLPADIPAGERELVMMAGRATHDALAMRNEQARQGFQELLARYPTTRGVHRIYGLFLLLSPDTAKDALPVLKRAVELFPDDAEAQLSVAVQIQERGNPTESLPYARAAARLLPRSFQSHLALGRALIANSLASEGLSELDKAESIGSETPDGYQTLAEAYSRAGREEDAQRVRAKRDALSAQRESTRPK